MALSSSLRFLRITLGNGIAWSVLASAAQAAPETSFNRHQLTFKGGGFLLMDGNGIDNTGLTPRDFMGAGLSASYDYRLRSDVEFGLEFLNSRRTQHYELEGRKEKARLGINGLLVQGRWFSAPPDMFAFFAGAGMGYYSGQLAYRALNARGDARLDIDEEAGGFGAHVLIGIRIPFDPSFGVVLENRLGWGRLDFRRPGHLSLLHDAVVLGACWNF